MSTLAATEPLTWFTLRRDRVRIVVWIAAIVIGMYLSAASTKGLFPTQADLDAAKAVSIDNPAAIAFNGPPIALDTMGGQIAFQIGAFGLTLVGLMAVLMTGRLTRGEEDSGRLELIRSMPVGQHGPMASTVAVVSAMSVLVGVLMAVSMLVLDLPVMGSLVFGASFTSLGLVFVGITLVTAQITENPRVVAGLAGAVLGASYVVRAVGDIGGGTLSWLSPIGIAQKSEPYAGDRWWPLLLNVALAALLVWGAAELASRRDFGGGLVPPRSGRATAAESLGTPEGFAVRLQRGVVFWWAVSVLSLGIAYGSVANSIESFIEDNPSLADVLARAGGASIVDSYLATTMLVLALVAIPCAVQVALRLRSEETAQRAEAVIAAGTPRSHWAGSHILVALVGGVVVLAAGGLGTGITYALIAGDAGQVPRLLGAALAFAPAVWVVAAVAVALFGLIPRWSTLAWALVAWCYVIGFLGVLLDLPQWLRDLSPLEHTPAVPAQPFEVVPLVVLTLSATTLIVLGLAGFNRRDIGVA
jgi:ABC-2 type transport system permease protein